MGIGGQAVAVNFLAELAQMVGGNSSLEIGPGVDAGRRVTLEENEVGTMLAVRSVEEVVEAHVEQGGNRREAGNVSTQLCRLAVRPYNHRHGIPADEGPDAALDGPVPRAALLVVQGYGVDVGRVCAVGQVNPRATGFVD